MKVSRANAFLIIALCVLFFILAYQTVSSPGTRQSSDSLEGSEKHKSPKSSHTPQKHKKKHSPTPQPQKGEKENPNIEYLIWTGIEISDDNPLYFPYRDLSKALECEQIANFPRNTFLFSSKLLSYFEKWIPKVGYNRIIDCLVARSVDISSKDLHQIGVALVQYYELHQDKITPRHLIEVNTRNLLNHAPLHGVVWGLIELQGIEDKENLFNYLDDLCYFQDDPTMGDIWISCVHGIGHAFADLFGYERLSEAIDLCDYHDDHDWKYSCATGAYMVYSKDKHWPEFGTSNSPAVTHWEPCDSEKFPAACFRFKKSDTFEEKAYPCQRFSNLRDTYRLRGCIWAHGFNLGKDNSIKKARDLCDLYGEQVPPNSMKSPELEDYLSCLDGFYHNSFWLEGEKKFTKSCQSLPFPEATDLCMRYASVDRFQYNALEHPWWNWELLEEL